jgi:Large polyvalent protein associated domain 29
MMAEPPSANAHGVPATREVDCSHTAAAVRSELHRRFPSTSFHVHSHVDRAGIWAMIDVSWTGGPEEPIVRAGVDRFVGYRITWSDDGDYTPIPIPISTRPDNEVNVERERVHFNVIQIELRRS